MVHSYCYILRVDLSCQFVISHVLFRYVHTYILILRANNKQEIKNIPKYGHNFRHRKHITITFLKLSILRANKKQRTKNIIKYGHDCKHRKHITITFQIVNFYWLIILIILVSSPHAHFKDSLGGNSRTLEFQSSCFVDIEPWKCNANKFRLN